MVMIIKKQDTPSTGNGPVQRITVAKSTQHKWVKFPDIECKILEELTGNV